MGTKRVIIEVSPSRLDVSVLSGTAGATVESTRSHRFPRSEWPQNFAETLKELDAPLAQIVTDLGVAKLPATVLYSAPGAVCTLTSCPAKAGLANAEQAARLALSNVADFILDGSPCETALVLRETAPKGDNANAFVPQSHVLAAADSELRVAAVASLVSRAGLGVERMLLADAAAIADAVAIATRPGEEEFRAILWFGDHSSFLAAGTPGRLLFIRPVNAGIESLVEALTRPLRPRDETEQPVTLARDAARSLVFSIGVPTPDQAIPDQPTLAGSALLPHLQPVLQRLAVEAKQSLRFGIPESSRGKVKLHMAGPGARIPNLADVLARQAGIPAAAPDNDPKHAPVASTTAAHLAHPSLGLNLLPSDLRSVAMSRRLRTALVAGAVVSALLVGFEFISSRWMLATERASLSQLEAKQRDQAQAAKTCEAALAARTALIAVERRMAQRLGDSTDFGASLRLLANETPQTVRLTDLELNTDTGAGKLLLRGYIRYADAADPATVINRYIATLSAVPIVTTARLGPTVRGEVRGADSQSFEITLETVPLPPATLTAVAAHTGPEAK